MSPPGNKGEGFRGATSLESSSSSFLSSSHGSSRGLEGEAAGGRGGRQGGGPAHFSSSFSLHGFGDFDTLESRLQKALDSPSLQVCVWTQQIVYSTPLIKDTKKNFFFTSRERTTCM